MRILDLGAHDAFVTWWLARQVADEVSDLHIDGLELHPDGVEIANRRMEEAGIPGRFIVGRAENAPAHFKQGSYDAVVAYELVEHVPCVETFLEACERMCAPEGRVYLSTPCGTFGAGANPHHLRVYTATDFSDLLRRRGFMEDLQVGRDGVMVGSYTPDRRKDRGDVAIFTGPGWETWGPLDIEFKGLGGSETAAARLAVHLTRLGYVVTVFGECDPGCVGQVVYRHWTTFDPTERRDAVIVSRQADILGRPLNAKCKLLWLHDVDCGPLLDAERAGQLDGVLALSRWHQRHLTKTYPFLNGKVIRTRNGIHHDYFAPKPASEREDVVLYTSSPDRGLDFLLEIWPRVLEQVPTAVLRCFYAGVYAKVADGNPVIGAHRRRLEGLLRQPGVEALPPQSQPALAVHMSAAKVWAHPSWSTPGNQRFHETSCIGAMEAQAAGARVVASNWGALPETVQVGDLLGERRGDDPPDPDVWVHMLVRALTDQRFIANAVELGPAKAAKLGWDGVAGRVAALIG